MSSLFVARSSNSASTLSQVTFTSDTNWEPVTIPQLPVNRVVLVENYTDGDIEVAFGSTAYADFIVKQNTDKVVSTQYGAQPGAEKPMLSPMYIRNISGTGGTVYVKILNVGEFSVTRGGSGSSGSSIVVTPGGDTVETRYLNAATTGINNNGGAFVAVGAALTEAITTLHVTTTIGEPLEFAIGPNCASSPTRKFLANRGEGPLIIGATIPASDFICVRSLTTTAVSSGEIVLNLMKAN